MICRIVDCLLKGKSFKSFFRFCQNVQSKLPLIWNVFGLSLCIGCDWGLTESIHSHIIVVVLGVKFLLFRFCHNFTDSLSKLLIGQWYIVTIIILDKIIHKSYIVFFFWGDYAQSFIRHVKSVQKIPTTFEYVKIARHFICN